MLFSKADGTSGDRFAYGPASTSIFDKQGDIVTGPALRKSLPSLLLNRTVSLNHSDIIPGRIVDSAKIGDTMYKTEVRAITDSDLAAFPRLASNGLVKGDEALFVLAKIHNDPVNAPYADDVWNDIQNGTLNSWSISGKAKDVSFKMKCFPHVCHMAKHIEDMAISSVALCRRGANPSATAMPLTKSSDTTPESYLVYSHRWDLPVDPLPLIQQMEARVRKGIDPTGDIARAAAHLRKYVDEHTLHDPTAPRPIHVDPEALKTARDALAPPLPGHDPNAPVNPLNPPPGINPEAVVDEQAEKGKNALMAATTSATPAPPLPALPKKPTVGATVPDHNPSLSKALGLRLRIAKGVMLREPAESTTTLPGFMSPTGKKQLIPTDKPSLFPTRRDQFYDATLPEHAAVKKEELTGKERSDLPDSSFADPEHRKFPINDPSHVKNALARANQSEHMSSGILNRIRSAAKKFEVDTKIESVKDLKKAAPERHTGRPEEPEGPRTKPKETQARVNWKPVPYQDKHGIQRTGASNDQGTMLYGQDAMHALSLMSRQGKSPEPGSAGETSDVPTQSDRVAGLEQRLAQLEGNRTPEGGEVAQPDPVPTPEDLNKADGTFSSHAGASNMIYGDPAAKAPEQPKGPKTSVEHEADVATALARALRRALMRSRQTAK